MLLAGDIGGTKTNLAIFPYEVGIGMPLLEATFSSGRYASLEELVRVFLAEADIQVRHASFGVPGPVVGGRATMTNLPWNVDARDLKEALQLESIHLLNDLEAIACAIPFLGPTDLHTLQEGESLSGGSIAVIASGTGLGQAFLTWDGTRYQPHASEGGHADFAPTSQHEWGLLRYLQERFGHVSYERICSGQGLPNIYAYLRDSGYAPEPAWLAKQLSATNDPTPVIVDGALEKDRPNELCRATLHLFVTILGAEAGNLALKVLATGGVYLGGGLPPRIVLLLEQGSFLEAFRGKGRLSGMLVRMPVHIIRNPKVAVLGAARRALET